MTTNETPNVNNVLALTNVARTVADTLGDTDTTVFMARFAGRAAPALTEDQCVNIVSEAIMDLGIDKAILIIPSLAKLTDSE